MRRFVSRGLAVACASLIIFSAGCSKENTPANSPAPKSQIPSPAVAEQTGFEATLPRIGGPEGYTGSQSCKDCHQDQFGSWHRTYHRSMTQLAGEDSVQADFNHVTLTNETVRFQLSRTNDEFWVKMSALEAPDDTQSLDVRIGLLTGSHHMQVFWAPEGDGNLQLGFPFTWLIPEKRWVPRQTTFIRPPEAPQRAEVWNIVCSRCHTTAVEPRVNMATRESSTRVAELGISCEACHGPGGKHVAAQNAPGKKNGAASQLAEGEIIHPKKISAERSAETCGFCHSMKWIDKSEHWREAGFRFRPGDELEKTTPIIQPSRADSIPGLAEYLARNPDILRDFFWADGMVRVSGREFNGVMESPCYKGKKFSCVSCHSMHESDPVGLVAEKAHANGACTQCHESFKEAVALQKHTRHPAGSAGGECYNCHMPFTTYGVLKGIRSHQISSPNIATELQTGRPNACNLCHIDQSLDWTAGHLKQWHLRDEQPEIPASASGIPEVVRLALLGDAAQRALAAWHLGWPETSKTSTDNYQAAFLGALLDDPYAAVRCIAQRSITKLGWIDLGNYDYTVEPRNRPPIRAGIFKQWQSELKKSGKTIQSSTMGLDSEDLEKQNAAFETFLRLRDNRPLRLRE